MGIAILIKRQRIVLGLIITFILFFSTVSHSQKANLKFLLPVHLSPVFGDGTPIPLSVSAGIRFTLR